MATILLCIKTLMLIVGVPLQSHQRLSKARMIRGSV